MSKRERSLVLYVDGASRGNPGPAGIGVVMRDGDRGPVLSEISESIGRSTNNVAEYRALLRALDEARALGADVVEIRSDSSLLINQLNGIYKVKSPDLAPLFLDAHRRLRAFRKWSASHIPRSQNAAADALANRAIDLAHPEEIVEYAVLIEERAAGFVARVPALPGVRVKGKTRSEALELAQLAAEQTIERLREAGTPLPREERIRLRRRPWPSTGSGHPE
jgi:ribonuclease HI/predicted RNase H-like HicB family nuclease